MESSERKSARMAIGGGRSRVNCNFSSGIDRPTGDELWLGVSNHASPTLHTGRGTFRAGNGYRHEFEATLAETNTPSPSVGVGSILVNGLIEGRRRGALAIWLITFVLALAVINSKAAAAKAIPITFPD